MTHLSRRYAILSCALTLAALGNNAHAYEIIDVSGGGDVSGTVSYGGDAPAPAQLEITEDVDYCGQRPIYDETVQVSASKGLANVVVFLKDIAAGAPPAPSQVTLDNTGCRYEPHILAFSVGSELSVKNSDAVLHNTHARLPRADVFNYALPRQGQVIESVIDRPGLMKVGCDAGHTWMSAYIAVFEHPYFAVTDAEGRYELPQVPPGEYSLVFWHESLGAQTQSISVTSAGAQASATFE